MIENELTEQIIGAAIEVHKHWGPGLYEEIYEKSMCVELRLRKLSFENQLSLPLIIRASKSATTCGLILLCKKRLLWS